MSDSARSRSVARGNRGRRRSSGTRCCRSATNLDRHERRIEAPAPAADKPSAQASDPQLAAQALPPGNPPSGKIDEAVTLFNNALERIPNSSTRTWASGLRSTRQGRDAPAGEHLVGLRAVAREYPRHGAFSRQWPCRDGFRATRPKPPIFTRSSSTSRWRNRPSMAPPAPRTPSAGCSSRPGNLDKAGGLVSDGLRDRPQAPGPAAGPGRSPG